MQRSRSAKPLMRFVRERRVLPPSAQFAKVLSDGGRRYVNDCRPNQSETIAVSRIWETTSWKSGKFFLLSPLKSRTHKLQFPIFLLLSDKLIAVVINCRSAWEGCVCVRGGVGHHTLRRKKSEEKGGGVGRTSEKLKLK